MKKIIKHFKTFSFFLGFAIDLFLLPKITSSYYVWVGPIDICVVFTFILIRQTVRRYLHKRLKNIKKEIHIFQDREEKIRDQKTLFFMMSEKANTSLTYIISFFLGTLLSHVLVYYFRSSDIFEVWPIFLIVIISIISNEFLYGIIPDILLFFTALTLYVIFNVPIFLNKVNNNTFLISILVSVIAISVLTLLLQRIYLSRKEFLFLIIFSIAFPFLILKLYYLNYIPAVPLALGDSQFYSYVQKNTNENNLVYYEKKEEGIIKEKKYFIIENFYANYEIVKNNENTLYFFSSIISPADVSATITHVWEKYDPLKKKWLELSRISYDVSGGREDGYRGYSANSSLSRGKWRVKVLADDRLVGLKNLEIR